jgi:hypothetical protein
MEILENVTDDEQINDDLIDPTNYADDDKVVARVKDEILTLIEPIRSIRLPVQQRWDRFRKCYEGIHTKTLYQGRAQLYWRLVYKIVETMVGQIKAGIFPTVDNFYVEPSPFDPMSMVNAHAARRIIRHDVQQAAVERWMDTFLRNGLIDGCSVFKSPWKSVKSKNYKRGQNKYGDMQFGASEVHLYNGPAFIPLDILDFYVHPITCQDLDEARLIFEDVTHDRNYLQSMVDKGQFDGDVVADMLDDNIGHNDANQNIVTTTDSSKDDRMGRDGITQQQVRKWTKNVYKLQEIWCKFDLYGNGFDIPCKIVAFGDKVLEVRQNPLFDQRAPYLAWKIRDKQNNFYGAGIVEPVEHVNVAANAVGNQFLDAVQMQTNHILGVNIALLGQDVGSLRIAPRAIWPSLGNPNDVFQVIRPPDNTQVAMMAMQLLSGVIQDISGAPPMLQGKFSNSDKTATEINAVAQGAGTAVAGMIRNVETMALSPMLYQWWKLEQQFRAVTDEEKIAGPLGAFRLAPEDLLGSYSMRWLVSTQVNGAISQFQQMMDAQDAQGGNANPPGLPPGAGAGGALPSMSPPGAPAAMGLGTQPNMGI